MPKNFYIADWHYDHANVLHYDNRPFNTVDEMNDTLVDRWNSAVSNEDTVYILGDMFWCGPTKAVPILQKLNGRKVLIKGNHDRINAEFAQQFDHITDYEEITDDGNFIVLCHYPIVCFRNHTREQWYHLYGHVHNSFEANMTEHSRRLMEELYGRRCCMYNVGAMMPYMDYTPRTLPEILTLGDKVANLA